MVKRGSNRLFTRIWISLILAGVLGHLLADIVAFGCLVESHQVCLDDNADSASFAYDVSSDTVPLLHAGFSMPAAPVFVAAFLMLVMLVFVTAKPMAVHLPILLPPPR